MTNAELLVKIKAEIERLKSIGGIVPLDNREQKIGYESALIDVETFLDTLESEKPINLEEEIKRFVAEYGYERSEDILLIAIVARHFYELGCHRTAEKYDEIEYNRQRAEEDTPNDLEEAAENIYKTPFGTRAEDFKAGAKWQKEQDEEGQADLFTIVALDAAQRAKEQMMKEAVKGEYDFYPAAVYLDVPIPRMNHGDKVRVIVLPKEDEK